MITALIIIYIIGYLCSFFLITRYEYRDSYVTISDLILFATTSIFSWVAVIGHVYQNTDFLDTVVFEKREEEEIKNNKNLTLIFNEFEGVVPRDQNPDNWKKLGYTYIAYQDDNILALSCISIKLSKAPVIVNGKYDN